MGVLPYLKAAVILVAIGVLAWLVVAAFTATEPVTYVNQTDSPLRFIAVRVDDPRYLSQVVVAAHSQDGVELPKNARTLRVTAFRPDGSVAFERAYGVGDLAREQDHVVVTPVPFLP